MSPGPTPRRRSRSFESDEEVESKGESQSKRPRTNGYHSDARSEDSEPEASAPRTANPASRNHRRPLDEDEDEENEGDDDLNTFQPGAIVRVKLTNFVTYENAEFFPGPSLNMVIGPNGTGKSSLVCALCLGLGWPPYIMGRAQEVGSYVKNGMDHGEIEIELQRKAGEDINYVVRVRIAKDNGREWWLNGRKTSLKNIQALTKTLSIQIDNLCQFLPQDKVSAFSGISPVDLLQRTQEAAAPEHMLEWHNTLKKLRNEEKELNAEQITDQATLENHETRQQNLQAEVERLQERQGIEDRVRFLKYALPMVDYRVKRAQHDECKTKKQQAQDRLRQLQARIAPTLESINLKKRYKDQIHAVTEERRNKVKSAEQAADRFVVSMGEMDTEIQSHESEVSTELKSINERKKDTAKHQTAIRNLTAQLNDPPPEFNASDWNTRVRAKEQELREYTTQLEEAVTQYQELSSQAVIIRERKDTAMQDLANFSTQEGQQMSKLEKVSKETAEAWKWVQDHMDEFEAQVYPPPMLSCSMKDPRYVNALESMLNKSDFLAITAQNSNDMRKLSNQIHETMRLTDVTFRTSNGSVPPGRPVSPEDLKSFGLDGWAIDFVDGPDAVLAMLCGSANLHQCAVTIQSTTEDQYALTVGDGRLRRWVTDSSTFNIVSRKEYAGAGAVNTKPIRAAQYWIDQPVDVSARNDIQAKIDAAAAEYERARAEAAPLNKAIRELRAKIPEIKDEVQKIKDDKAALQTAHKAHSSLPVKIKHKEELLEDISKSNEESRDKIRKARNKLDHAVIRKVKEALKYKEQVSVLRSCHEELLETRLRLLEAESDVMGLEDRNRDIVRQQNEEKERVRAIEQETKMSKDAAKRAQEVVMQLFSDPEVKEQQDELTGFSEGYTVESLEVEIAAEESKLDYVHANNPNAIRDFEKRQAEIDKLKAKIQESAERLERISRKITKTREKWEPALDSLIEQISEAFSYNFEQIGCAGEVSVHKDDDFNQWAIQIKVKFRENETLQILDQHRQSGGERSVSTIFYLMSLQALAQAPFRVVDEINQGMDPRNERMVHERMVDIACREHTSQYFLITPKLLTGLRYHRRMKVLCIASGEHMPENYKKLDINKIIGIRRAIMASG